MGTSRAGELKVDGIVLLNPMKQFEERASDAKTISSYIKVIEKVTLEMLIENDSTNHRNGVVVVAVRPGNRMKLWIDLDGKFQPELTNSVQKQMASRGVPLVAEGPIAFALQLKDSTQNAPDQPAGMKAADAIPEDWRRVLARRKDKQLVLDELLSLVWPVDEIAPNEEMQKAKAIAADADTFVPEGYVTQSLNPTGGSLPKPKDWYYSEDHRKRQLTWTISKEPSEGGYVTGVKIQLFIGVGELTKQQPEAFLKNFLQSKIKTAKVISRRDPVKQGPFTRVGLETEEPQADKDKPPFRILYSCFWDNDRDIAAIAISGTTTDLWESYQETFNVMSSMTLIDLDKMKKPAL